jgi:hypothetical protein
VPSTPKKLIATSPVTSNVSWRLAPRGVPMPPSQQRPPRPCRNAPELARAGAVRPRPVTSRLGFCIVQCVRVEGSVVGEAPTCEHSVSVYSSRCYRFRCGRRRSRCLLLRLPPWRPRRYWTGT